LEEIEILVEIRPRVGEQEKTINLLFLLHPPKITKLRGFWKNSFPYSMAFFGCHLLGSRFLHRKKITNLNNGKSEELFPEQNSLKFHEHWVVFGVTVYGIHLPLQIRLVFFLKKKQLSLKGRSTRSMIFI